MIAGPCPAVSATGLRCRLKQPHMDPHEAPDPAGRPDRGVLFYLDQDPEEEPPTDGT